ncbi:hypothetical protein ACFL3G_01510 [Planctomycetota bacterium]
MAIEAPVSKFRKNNLKIYMVFALGLLAWCVYDGYFNEKWIEEHRNEDGSPKTYLTVNRRAPYLFVPLIGYFVISFFVIKNKKIVADENELVISNNFKISYDSIQAIDKTLFEKKGKFSIIYNDQDGREVSYKLSDRRYDNLSAVLEHITAKIS